MIENNKFYLIAEKDLSYLFRTLLGRDVDSLETAADQCNVDVSPAGDVALFQVRPIRSPESEDSWMTVSKRAFDAIAADPTSGCCQRIVYTCSGLVLTNVKNK
jgi:hypothetical protein